MKKGILHLLKLCISGILALAILSGLCLLYYNPPIAVAQPDRYTNYRYTSNSNWANMTEGAGWGRINNIGYSDRSNYDPTMPTVAFIGSSQVQAMQVPQNKNFVSLTHDLFTGDTNPGNDYQCLNLGVAGHFFNITASNFDYFAEQYAGTADYVIFEVSTIDYTEEQLDKILAKEYHSDKKAESAVYELMQRIPYVRLLAKQLQDLRSGKTVDTTKSADATEPAVYQKKMNQIIKDLATTADHHDIKLIFLYHHPLKLNADNTAQTGNKPEFETLFAECCKQNNVPLINMNQVMIDHFEKTYEPSYGFANSKPGQGHLNEVGHRLIAQEVYAEINKQTEGK